MFHNKTYNDIIDQRVHIKSCPLFTLGFRFDISFENQYFRAVIRYIIQYISIISITYGDLNQLVVPFITAFLVCHSVIVLF